MCDQCEQSEKTLLILKSLQEHSLTSFLSDECEQSEQNPFKYQHLLGIIFNYCDQCEQSEKYFKTSKAVRNSF